MKTAIDSPNSKTYSTASNTWNQMTAGSKSGLTELLNNNSQIINNSFKSVKRKSSKSSYSKMDIKRSTQKIVVPQSSSLVKFRKSTPQRLQKSGDKNKSEVKCRSTLDLELKPLSQSIINFKPEDTNKNPESILKDIVREKSR